MTSPFTASLRRFRTAASVACIVACIVAFGACASPPSTGTPVADWCWRHLALAPPGALIADDGPADARDAPRWDVWLGQLDDAPPERHDAHRTQRELIDALIDHGSWSDESRERYRRAANSGPTPSTLCETVGARVIINEDGSLPTGWQRRFLDSQNPAFSDAAAGADQHERTRHEGQR